MSTSVKNPQKFAKFAKICIPKCKLPRVNTHQQGRGTGSKLKAAQRGLSEDSFGKRSKAGRDLSACF